MATQTDDEEVLDQEDDKKKQSIGKPIAAVGPQPPAGGVPVGMGQTSPVGAPIVSPSPQLAQSQGAAAPSQEIPAPYSNPTSIGTPITPPMTPRPQYHGLNRVLDSIAGATQIGSDIEAAGGLGTQGWRQTNADEEKQIEEGEKSRQANATAENVGAEAQQHTAEAAKNQAEAENVGKMTTVTINGVQYTVPQKDAEKLIGTGVTQAGASQRTEDTNQTRKDVADTQVKGRADVAAQKPEVRNMGDHTEERQPDGSWKVVGPAQKTGGGETRPQLMYVPQPDGTYQAIQVSAGSTVPQGAQTATGVNTMSTPTSQTRTRGEMANVTKADEAKTFAQIDHLAAKIGPGEGRWNQFWVNKAGLNDPDFSKLDSTLGAYASGLAITHFGARGGGSQYIQQMRKEFGEAQSPEDLKARMQAWDEKMAQYAEAAGVKQPQAPAATGATGGGGFASWKANH